MKRLRSTATITLGMLGLLLALSVVPGCTDKSEPIEDTGAVDTGTDTGMGTDTGIVP
jgi:hypothetical protein